MSFEDGDENVTVKFVIAFVMTLSATGYTAEVSSPKTGGAMLEYPRGTFQENSVPNFFKWTVTRPLKSITVKVFRTRPDGAYDPSSDLISRFEFLPTVTSMNWSLDSLIRGHYIWLVEGYDTNSPRPIYADSATFEVGPIKKVTLQTTKLGLLVGFSRGKYSSEDADYILNYDTTPTFYGLVFKDGSENNIWELDAFASDFILQGEVQRSFTVFSNYLFRVTKYHPYESELFFGPTLRLQRVPRVRTDAAATITKEDLYVGNPGVELALQRQFDMHITLFAKAGIDINAFGSDPVIMQLDQLSYNVHAGLLYGLFWPIAFSGEVQYKSDKTKSRDGNQTVETRLDDWSVAANLYFAF